MLDVRSAVKAAALASVPLALCALLYAVPARGDDPEPLVAKLRFEGVEAFETRAVEERMETAAPSWKPWVPDPSFDEQTLREDLDRVVGFYREWGYYEAQAEYARAVHIDPSFALARNDLGLLLYWQGKYDQAREQYEKAVHADPSCIEAHYNLAVLCEEQGDAVRALTHYRKAVRMDPIHACDAT